MIDDSEHKKREYHQIGDTLFLSLLGDAVSENVISLNSFNDLIGLLGYSGTDFQIRQIELLRLCGLHISRNILITRHGANTYEAVILIQ